MDDRSNEPERGRPADPPSLPAVPPPPSPGAGAAPSPPPSGDAWAMGANAAPESSRGRRGRRALIVLAVAVGAVVLLGGIGMAAVMFVLRGSPERLSTRTPADADFFATAYLDPSAAQKINLTRTVTRFPSLGSGEQLRDSVDGALDGALSSTGLTTDDIRPWLGSQVAIAGRIEDAGVSFAVLVDSSDDARAEATLAQLRARPQLASEDVTWSSIGEAGTTIWIGHPQFGGTPIVLAVDDGTVVLGNSVTFASDVVETIAGAGALEDSPSFRRATASLPDDVLGLGYVNAGSVFDRLPGVFAGAAPAVTPSEIGSIADPSSIEGFALSLSAEPSGLELDLASTVDPTKLSEQQREALTAAAGEHGPNDALTWVPANAYAIAATNVFGDGAEGALASLGVASDPALRGLTSPNGVLAHLTGDAALEASPGRGEYPTGAIVVGTDDESGMRAFLDGLAERMTRSLAPAPLDALNASGIDGVDPSNARAIRRLLHEAAHPAAPSWSSSTYQGVTIFSLDTPEAATGTGWFGLGIRPSYAVADGVGILAASPEAIRAMIDAHGGADSIATSPAYNSALAALGGLDDQVFYVDVDRVVAAIREALPREERASLDRAVAPNLEPIDAFVGGTRSSPSGSTARMLLLIR